MEIKKFVHPLPNFARKPLVKNTQYVQERSDYLRGLVKQYREFKAQREKKWKEFRNRTIRRETHQSIRDDTSESHDNSLDSNDKKPDFDVSAQESDFDIIEETLQDMSVHENNKENLN